MRNSSYVIVSPCRNEAEFMRRTLDSVIAQTVVPSEWVIVDDGSTDASREILAQYAERVPFIRVVRREDRGRRQVGAGVIDAFYAGLDTVDLDQFDFLCKLDLDLEMPPGYFEEIIGRMHADPRLGTCSGKAYYKDKSGELVPETIGDDVSVGAAKFYRTESFAQIGGLVRAAMWDGIDCHRCRMRGWKACSWDEPELRFLHLRPMGSSQKSIFHGRMRHGRGQFFMGTSSTFIVASAAFRAFKRPYIVGSAAILLGFFGAMLRRSPRYPDREFRRFLRSYQWRCLLYGKHKARQMTEEKMSAAWKPDGSA